MNIEYVLSKEVDLQAIYEQDFADQIQFGRACQHGWAPQYLDPYLSESHSMKMVQSTGVSASDLHASNIESRMS